MRMRIRIRVLFLSRDANLRPLVYRPFMVPFEPLRLHCEHLRASNALFGAYTAPEFDFDADPDPGFHSDADPVPASQNDADPDVKRS